MFPVLRVIGLTLPVGPLSLLLALYLGLELSERALTRNAPADKRDAWRAAFQHAAFISLVAGLVGARVGYALQYHVLYRDSPALLLSLRPGTLSLWPGVLTAGLVAVLILRRKQLSLSVAADAGAIGIAGALLVFSVGNFLTGRAYGTVTNVPWGVEMWGAVRHPVQLYTAVALGMTLVVLWYLQRRALPGEILWRFALLYSLSQLFLAAFRANAATWGPEIRIGQTVALVVLLGSMYVLSYYAQQRERLAGGAAAGGLPEDMMSGLAG